MASTKLTSVLSAIEDDIKHLLAAQCRIGAKNCKKHMKPYVYKCWLDSIHVINICRIWEKFVFAARIIAAAENPRDVCVVSAPQYGQRDVLKFAVNTGTQAIAGRFTPGNFTNYITRSFKEPRLLVVTDPRISARAVLQAAYVNISVTALCDANTPLQFVDVAILTNKRARHWVGLRRCLLCREVPCTKGRWDNMVGMFFYRDSEEAEKQQREKAVTKTSADQPEAATNTEWDVGAAPQARAIYPNVLESGVLIELRSLLTPATIGIARLRMLVAGELTRNRLRVVETLSCASILSRGMGFSHQEMQTDLNPACLALFLFLPP